MSETANILVVGAGPSGLMMAGELARHGVPCRIVDRNDGPTKESRALGVQARTIQIFDSLGLSRDMLDRGKPMRQGHIVIHGNEILELDFTAIPGKYNFILAYPQSETERILLKRLNRLGIGVARKTEVASIQPTEDSVAVRFADGHEETFDWVLGCDGAHSVVRQGLGLRFEGDKVPQGFLLADLTLEWDRPEGMYLLAGETGFLALFPLPGDRWRMIATTSPGEQGPIEFAEIERLFKERCPYGGRVRDPAWTSRFVIQERIVDRMREGRAFVVGDAAHVHSPAGGQGMNTGLHDAHNLAWKLAMVVRGLADGRVLDSYHSERYPVDQGVVEVTRVMMRNMVTAGPVVSWVRDHIAPHVISLPAVHRRLMETISEQSVSYSNSPIVGQGGGHWADAEDLPGAAMHLLLGRDATRIAEFYQELCIGRNADCDLRIIRPDGYVGAVGADSLNSYFTGLGVKKLFGPPIVNMAVSSSP